MDIENKEPRAILLVKNQVFYSTGITQEILPVRPEDMDQIRNPMWEMQEVWKFNHPELYANGQTAWFQNIAANLDGYYDPEKAAYVLTVVYWAWAPEGKVVVQQ
jgi:hypothetical protein